MCELFGINSLYEVRANDLLDAFYRRSEKQPHGWGLAVFGDRKMSVEKEPVKALNSSYLTRRLSGIIEAKNLLAHIRLATVGDMTYVNCHPFSWNDSTGRTWTLIHNGTIFETDLISPFFSQQEGTTDSEGILLCLIDRIDHKTAELGRPLTPSERFAVIDKAVVALAECGKLNMILFDGEQMYVHTNYRGFLHFWKQDSSYCFSTHPLPIGTWEPLPLNQLLGFISGALVQEGTSHPHEYLDSEHDMSLIYAAYASL